MGEDRTRSALPPQTKAMASVTTMSGTRVATMRLPLMAPSSSPRTRTPMTTAMPNSSLWPFICVAATTLVRAIIEPIERSIPPPMTQMAWATAAMASGRTEMAKPWTPVTP